jgi:hypothetical protein
LDAETGYTTELLPDPFVEQEQELELAALEVVVEEEAVEEVEQVP